MSVQDVEHNFTLEYSISFVKVGPRTKLNELEALNFTTMEVCHKWFELVQQIITPKWEAANAISFHLTP